MQMMAARSSAAAQIATQAASLQLDLGSLGERTARVSREQNSGQTVAKAAGCIPCIRPSCPTSFSA